MKFLNKKNNFLYLTILVFVFVSTSALAINGKIPELVKVIPAIAFERRTFVPIPILDTNANYPVISAQGAMAVDLNSGIPLYEKNPDSTLLPASTTKIITALVALDSFPLDQILTVGKVHIEGQKMGLIFGEQLRVEDLLYGLLVYSANDAAEVLAQNYPGGRDEFIIAMNNKAAELSMERSKFQ